MATSTTGNGWPGKYLPVPWEFCNGNSGMPCGLFNKMAASTVNPIDTQPFNLNLPLKMPLKRCVRQVAKEKEESKPMEPVRRAKRIDMINIYLQVVGRYF